MEELRLSLLGFLVDLSVSSQLCYIICFECALKCNPHVGMTHLHIYDQSSYS